MTAVNKGLFREGDWVSGASQEDEKFIGYVLSIDHGSLVHIGVTQSDREEIVGHTVQTKLAKVRKLTDDAPSTSEELRSLIELALATHDKAWFEELSAKLTTFAKPASDRSVDRLVMNPRLRGFTASNPLDV